ncbi:type II secretion system GspH family protein [Candidatus Kaiserbacteria bacterium]|nr:type II secretion system GspH family protein [Candidatus Kaiserbacteria bacterium]
MKTLLRKRTGIRTRGFTLVEMIVAVGLFAIVMLVSISALLSLVDANRKAQALQSVMNNLSIAVDGMVREIREGSNYRCGGVSPSNPNCTDAPGGSVFYFTPNCTGSCSDWAYVFDSTGTYCGTNRLCRSVDGGVSFLPLTSPEVTIDASSAFYVIGAARTDQVQPKVLIIIKGSAGVAKAKVRTTFHIQSTAVQRVLDI